MTINAALYARSYKDPEAGIHGVSHYDLRFLHRLLHWLLVAMFATFIGGVLLMGHTARAHLSFLTPSLTARVTATRESFSGNVSTCPGYTLSSLHETQTGLTAALSLAGPACNAFGHDIANLTLEVTYDTETRLHVNIYDTAKAQFTVPKSAVELASGSGDPLLKQSSDLVFNHESSPFAFWITRRSEPDALPLFDTRISSLPSTPIPPSNTSDNTTGFDGFPLVFEDQYLQLTSALPLDANVYGLGEVVASSGFRRDVGANGSPGTLQTMWARDAADPVDENIYGSHPIYLEHRFNETTKKSHSHGVFLFSAAGSDTFLQTPPSSPVSLIQYRLIGGVLDFYFFSGPSPQAVIEQYGALVGLPTWQPLWGFGFHLCRWGYHTVNETKEQVQKMREAGIPLETMWNDIDLYHAYRDFTTDPVSFPIDEVKAFIEELAANNQHYIPIVDAAIAHQMNATDFYDPYTEGTAKDVWVKNPDGSTYIGQVWPGYTVFPDWFSENIEAVWTEAFKNWSDSGVAFSGIWLDMNEVSSFCTGSCGTGANLSIPVSPFVLPGAPGNLVTEYPEGYNATVWGPSGNITINGTTTYNNNGTTENTFVRRGFGSEQQKQVNFNAPLYPIHNGFGLNDLDAKTLATNATHANGLLEIHTHNLWGLMEEKATHLALLNILPAKRPFIIARSTFASSGKWTGHWLGDNYSKWSYLHYNIQGVLQFQLFQIPMVGADTCGFQDNTDEELCNRWMQLSAFVPFYRNHNQLSSLSQEPYRWDSVANASRTAIAIRYSMLPYWYTLFANSSLRGTPPVRALFFEFPDEPELFGIDSQFLIGRDILVTPVLTPNVSTVAGIFPGRGKTVWRDWYTHKAVDVPSNPGDSVTLDAPLGHINVHVRDGAVVPLYAKPGYTVTETAGGPYSLLITLDQEGNAFGTAYVDDGESLPPTPHTTLTFTVAKGRLTIHQSGNFHVAQKIESLTLLGVRNGKPSAVEANSASVQAENWEFDEGLERLMITNLALDLNSDAIVTWA